MPKVRPTKLTLRRRYYVTLYVFVQFTTANYTLRDVNLAL